MSRTRSGRAALAAAMLAASMPVVGCQRRADAATQCDGMPAADCREDSIMSGNETAPVSSAGDAGRP